MLDFIFALVVCGFIVFFLKKTCDHEFEDYE